MSDDDYYTTDTESVAPEIDVSDVDSGNHEGGDEWRFEWKRPVGYLLLFLLVAFALLVAGLWLGVRLPLVP